MDVGMSDERLPPRVQDAEEADRRAEVFGVGGDLEQRGRAGVEQQVIETRRIASA